jgi:uncharacterized protein YuzE
MNHETDFQLESLYDHSFDVLGIKISNDYEYKTSVELSNNVILDFDKNNVPVALEILNASRFLKISKSNLDHINMIKMKVHIDDKSICLKVSVGVNIHKKEHIKSIDTFTSNDTGIPSIEREMVTV